MASNTVCSSCLRAMRQQARLIPTSAKHASRVQVAPPLRRTFTTSSKLRVQANQDPDGAPPRPPPAKSYPDNYDVNPMTNMAAKLRNSSALRGTTEPYIAYGSTEDLFLECSKQCSYTIPSALEMPPQPPPQNEAGDHLGEGSGWWLTPKAKGGLGLEVTFNSWAQVMYLHMWLLTARLRCFPEKYVKDWHQNLLDHFFYAAEDRMATWHGMAARGVRNKNLKDLWTQWRGVQLAYDEGLIKGDAVMATAIWRNIFKADPNVDLHDLAVVTGYLYRELRRLGMVSDRTISEGTANFGDPRTVEDFTSLSKEAVLKKAAQKAERMEAGMPPEHQPS